MKLFYKIISVIILVCITLSLTGCNGKKAESVAEAITLGTQLKSGIYEFYITSKTQTEGAIYQNPAYKITGYTDGQNHLLSFEYNVNGQTSNLENAVCISKDKIYLKAHAMVDFFAANFRATFTTTDFEDKWVVIPFNSLDDNSVTAINMFNENFISFISQNITDIGAVKLDDAFQVTLQDANQLYQFMNKIITYLSDNDAVVIDSANAFMAANKNSDIQKWISATDATLKIKNRQQENGDSNKDTEYDAQKQNENDETQNNDGKEYNSDEVIDAKSNIQKLISMLSSAAGEIKAAKNASALFNINYSEEEKFGVFTVDGSMSLTQEVETTEITFVYSFKEADVTITLPDVQSIFSTADSLEVGLPVWKEVLSSIIKHFSQENETYIPEYTSSITGNTLTRVKIENLYKEKITYHVTSNGVSSIGIEIETYDSTIHNALMNYYNTIGYEIKDNVTSNGTSNVYGIIIFNATSNVLQQFTQFTTAESLLSYLK